MLTVYDSKGDQMDLEQVYKALSNELRRDILMWLKLPVENFPLMEHLPESEQGKGYICVSCIRDKANITQSTISSYLMILKKAGLLKSKRIGQWTYYKRDEEFIKSVIDHLKDTL